MKLSHSYEIKEFVYHVSAAANRQSIAVHGLDWRRMGAAPGLASGETAPEAPAIFLCGSIEQARWFAGFAEGRFPVDIWGIHADGLQLAETEEGYLVTYRSVEPERLTLYEASVD